MAAAVEYVEFTQDQADAWDRMQKLKEKAAAGDKARNEAKDIKEQLCADFGECAVAVLPDGRKLLKAEKSMKRKAQPASEYSWWEISEG